MANDRLDSRPGLLVGITGGYGSGKSTVCRILARHHPVLSSDLMARELTDTDPSIRKEIRSTFGSSVFGKDGTLDRAALASVVFAHPDKRRRLNAIIHPRTIARVHTEAEAHFAKGSELVFVESALIYEADLADQFAIVVAVIARKRAVIERLGRAGIAPDAVELRLRSQLDPQEKARRADFVLHNDGSFEELERATLFVLRLLETTSRPMR